MSTRRPKRKYSAVDDSDSEGSEQDGNNSFVLPQTVQDQVEKNMKVDDSDSKGSEQDGNNSIDLPQTVRDQVEKNMEPSHEPNSEDSDSQIDAVDNSNSCFPLATLLKDEFEESVKVLSQQQDLSETDSQNYCHGSKQGVLRHNSLRKDVEESLKVVSQQMDLTDTISQIDCNDSNERLPHILQKHVDESIRLVTQPALASSSDSLGPSCENQSTTPLEGKPGVTEDIKITFKLGNDSFLHEILPYDDNARGFDTSFDCSASLNKPDPTSKSHSEATSEFATPLRSYFGWQNFEAPLRSNDEQLNQSGFTDFVQNGSTPLRETSDLSLSKLAIPPLSPVRKGSTSPTVSDGIVSRIDSDMTDNSRSPISNKDNSVSEEISVNEEENNSNSTKFQKALSLATKFKTLMLHENSELNVTEGILQVMDLFIQNKESKSGFRRIVQTVSNLLPENNNLPSGNIILQFVEDLAPDVEADVHFFCKVCLQYFSEKPNVCDVCRKETETGEFYTFDIAKIIKFLFESRDLASIIDSMPQSDPALLKDIQDGYIYKNANANRQRYDVNVVLGTDGVKVRKGSANELWLLMFVPVEVPPHLKDSYTFIIGVWYDKVKPRGNTFFRPFCDNVQRVEIVGVEWRHPISGELHHSLIRITVIIADAPARAMCQNIMNHNSKHGCNLCDIKTQKTRRIPGKKRIRVYRYVENLVLRTEQSMHNNAVLATQQGTPVMGVKGFSRLSLLNSVDISQVVFPEFMHSVLLGVTRQVIKIWIEKPGEWSIANSLDEIDLLLSQIKHPSFVHRTNRSLQSRKLWKASDFYYFLLFESLIVLSGIIPDLYYQHFILLVKSIFTLLKRGISEYDLQEAESMLKLFVFQFAALYSERELTYNVHQLLHLSLSVRRYGPLSCNSAFPFEGINGTVAKGSHGTNFVGKEIVKNIKIYQGVVILRNISEGYGVEQPMVNLEPTLLGSSRQLDLSFLEKQFLENKNPSIFSRAKIGCETYTSEIYKVLSSSNFHVMWILNSKRQYGSIKYFAKCKDSNELFLCIRLYEVEQVRVVYHRETLKCIEHLIPFKTTDDSIFVNVCEINSSLTKVGTVGNYLFVRPNLIRQIM